MYDFDQYFAVRRYLDLAMRPDGREVAYSTDITGNFNLWRQDAGGGWPYQLTAFREWAVQRVAWSPDGKWLAFAADREGDENYQIHVMPGAGGPSRRVTARPDVRYLLGASPWAPDGRTLACSCNAENAADFDLVLLDTATGATRRVSREPFFYQAVCWSPEGRFLCGIIDRGAVHQDLVLLDREELRLHHPTEGAPPARRWPIGFSADGSALYLLTDEGREFQGLARFDLRTGDLDWLRTPERDIDLACLSADARWLLYTVNEDGAHRVELLDRNSGLERAHQALPMGEVVGLSIAAGGRRAAMLHSAATRPAEVVVFDFAKRGLEPITQGMIGAVPGAEMVEPRIVRLPSFDRKIPALLYRPRGAVPEGGFPAVLFIHGGPQAQERPSYRPLYQYLLSRGLLILAPNIRGSTGYGKAYQELIHRDWGGGDLRDLEATARYLGGLKEVDARRMAVAGASYGGFAALSCATRLPEHWAAAVDVCGPSNLVTFGRSIPPSWRRFLPEWMGDPERDEKDLLLRSPILHVDKLRCPLLVIQGANDPRVVREESDRMVARIRARGGSVEYLVIEGEGHSFLKRSNELRAGRAIAEFLLQEIGKA